MSAHDEKTLVQNIQAHQKIAADYHLPDLAYSLNSRRTRFASRGYTIALSGRESETFSSDSFAFGSTLLKPPKLGFVLTGQGAQWARMGYAAIQKYPNFAEIINALDRVLQRIDPPPAWNLSEILEAPAECSHVGEPQISQPAGTAIQIAIIDLLSSWEIKPTVTVGHSSGEMAAAYAAGRISAPEAIVAAYFRGLTVAQAAPVGTMLAVGLGAKEVQDHLETLPPEVAERVTIACKNSPSSVTMSGSHEDIATLEAVLDNRNIFARQLRTGKAYHSPQMDAVTPLYEELCSKAYDRLTERHLEWRLPYADMISSVTGS